MTEEKELESDTIPSTLMLTHTDAWYEKKKAHYSFQSRQSKERIRKRAVYENTDLHPYSSIRIENGRQNLSHVDTKQQDGSGGLKEFAL